MDKKKSLNRTLAIKSHFKQSNLRLPLPLRTPEMLSSSSKSRIFLYNAHLALFVRWVTQNYLQKCIGKHRHYPRASEQGNVIGLVSVCIYIYIRLVTRVSMKYDELFHE